MDDNSDNEPILISSVASSGKSEQIRDLSQRLLRESLTRQEIDELYHKLQSEYDTLLTRHALAENTIDQLRIGARVNLFSDGPTPHQAQPLRVVEIKSSPQPISVPSKERAVIEIPDQLLSTSTHSNNSCTGNIDSVQPNADSQSSLLHRLKDLQNDIVAFQSAVACRELSFEEQKNLYDALKEKHGNLKEELEKVRENDGSSVIANSTQRSPAHSFLDPSSLEGELYRLELRLAEVCDDIGDQLYSNGENDGALEQALRDDFQRMRLSSIASARSRSPSGHHLPRNVKSEDESKAKVERTSKVKVERTSRSNSDLSDPVRNRTLSKEGEGSFSNYDKKETLSPSNEDLAESGYYASESIIRESPKREVTTNVPIRYLTRSRSPREKAVNGRPLRRHWSLSAYNSQSESIEEITLTDDEVDFSENRRPKSDGVASGARSNEQLKESHSTGHSPKRTSKCLPTGGSSTAPAATSSPYEERSLQEMPLLPQERDSQAEAGDEVSTHRKRSKKSYRASPSDRSVLEGKSDGRRSSVKSVGRLSKTRPRQYNYSSSEESYAKHRPERLNSSVYSEQDKVPSLVNLPKSNFVLSRHRPNTAESNLDSGFVGSEGTLKSQDLSNSLNNPYPRPSRRGSVTKPVATTGHPTRPKFNDPVPANATEVRSTERHRHSSTRDNPADRLSARSNGSSKVQLRDKRLPDSSETNRSQPMGRLREVGRRTSMLDDVISVHTSPETQTDASFRRLPVSMERSPFGSSEPFADVEDSPLKSAGQQREAERYGRSTLSSAARSSDPRQPLSTSKGDRPSWHSDLRGNRIPSSSGDRMRQGGEHSLDEDSMPERVIEPRKHRQERMPQSLNESSHRLEDIRPSHYADRLHRHLQLLRDQLSQLNRMHIPEDRAIRLRGTEERSVSPDTPRLRAYDDVKHKLDDLANQLQKSLNNVEDRSSPDRGYKPNRDYQELKDKIDYLTRELQKTQEYAFKSGESMDQLQFAIPPSRPHPEFRESEPVTAALQEPLFTFQGATQDRLGTTQYSRSAQPKHPYHSRTYIDSQQPRPTLLRSLQAQPAVLESPPTYITVCPVCSDVGYHRHGDYLFQGKPIPNQPPVLQAPASPARMVVSTPNSTQNRSMPDLHSVEITPMRQMPSTIHHIHTIHKSRKSSLPSSSSESQSDSETEKRRERRRNRASSVKVRVRSSPRVRDGFRNRRLDELNDWRLNESLDEAARAASSMQIASRRMLNNLAADLIKSGYSKY